MGAFINLTGQRFGHLTVLYRGTDKVYSNGAIAVRWVCRCDCGQMITVFANSLRKGSTRSCGCARSEYFTEKHINRKHGGSFQKGNGERLYRVWLGMKERCHNPNHNRYKDHGGEGYMCAINGKMTIQHFVNGHMRMDMIKMHLEANVLLIGLMLTVRIHQIIAGL